MARRWALGVMAAAVTALAAPAAASATCEIPTPPSVLNDPTAFDPPQSFAGTFHPSDQGSYVQIPFDVPSATTGIRVRYCFDEGSTLDIGLYDPRPVGDVGAWGPAERRGWSGSAVRTLSIARNGFTDDATYEADRKAYVPTFTTRAYQPGPIPAGEWAAELGVASISPDDLDGVDWQVVVETTSDPSWADDPYSPTPYDDSAANPTPGWYAGDVHVHGEQEPGNATMRASFDYAFRSLAAGGAGLDFVGLVDHNNDVNRGEIGRFQPDYPGKLIIPGTEVTTYHGHYNNLGSSTFADFRGGPTFRLDPGTGSLTQVQGAVAPASQFGPIRASGGWTQINHPTIFPSNNPGNVAVCRGCPWDYDDAETNFGAVDAIEIQTGPADLGSAQNPFTLTAIAFYERALAAGHHIAAVGSSDSHQADQTDVTTAPIGRATTVVHADRLSRRAIVAGIRADHTYVKPYGNDGPDIRVTGTAPGAADAILGDSLQGPSAAFDVEVLGAGPGATRPGSYELRLLRDGVEVDSTPVSGDDFLHRFGASESGRYSFEVVRLAPDADRIEIYSSPIWFQRVGSPAGRPANEFRFGRLKHNRRRGTAKLDVIVPGPGELRLVARRLKRGRLATDGAGTVKLEVKTKRHGFGARRLRRRGKVGVKPKVTYTPTGGDSLRKKKPVKLRLRR
jgi:hypothetical protein